MASAGENRQKVRPSGGTKHCAYGACNSDSRYAHREHMKDVFFVTFPKPKTNLEKCQRWVKACGRENFTPERVWKWTYICSKHFVGGKGPTVEHPDPIPASCIISDKPKRQKKRAKLVLMKKDAVSQYLERDVALSGSADTEPDPQSAVDVLLIEPFYAGSHKQLMDTLNQSIPGSHLVALPGKKWPWKARTSALFLSQVISRSSSYRTLFTSSVLNLAEFIALRPDLQPLHKVIYFHENQLTYPVQKQQERDFQFGYNQILSCLVADLVLFNSAYNMECFLSSINSFLKKIPDHRPSGLEEVIRKKSKVLYFPIAFPDQDMLMIDDHNYAFSPDTSTASESEGCDEIPVITVKEELIDESEEMAYGNQCGYDKYVQESSSEMPDDGRELFKENLENDHDFEDNENVDRTALSESKFDIDTATFEDIKIKTEPELEGYADSSKPGSLHDDQCFNEDLSDKVPMDSSVIKGLDQSENSAAFDQNCNCGHADTTGAISQGSTTDAMDTADNDSRVISSSDCGSYTVHTEGQVMGMKQYDMAKEQHGAAKERYDVIREQCDGKSLQGIRDDSDANSPLHIVWPHRWEYDKGPEKFFDVMYNLQKAGCDFRLSVLGERFTQVPHIFEEAKNHLQSKVDNWGYVESKEDYYRILSSADCVISTSLHEFFGVAILEAVHCGCYPLCPNRLVYPEIFPKECLYNTDNQLFKLLRGWCKKPQLVRRKTVKIDTKQYSWASLKDQYIECLYGLPSGVGMTRDPEATWSQNPSKRTRKDLGV